MIHFDLSLNTVVSALIVAGVVGIARLSLKTALILSNLHGRFDQHILESDKVDDRVHELERRAMGIGVVLLLLVLPGCFSAEQKDARRMQRCLYECVTHNRDSASGSCVEACR